MGRKTLKEGQRTVGEWLKGPQAENVVPVLKENPAWAGFKFLLMS